MYRNDGSVNSVNNPVWSNRYEIRDYGIYKAVIRDIVYTDDDSNNSGDKEPNEVLYSVMIIGGDRDGQLFDHARVIRSLGGFDNWEEVILKPTESVSQRDIADIAAVADPTVNKINKLSGDVVYIQFLSGDIHMPVIVGMAKHQADNQTEATEDDGPQLKRRYNGIYTEINKDGEFTWSKDNGAWAPFGPNLTNPQMPVFVNQFVPLLKDAVTISLGNQFDFSFEYSTGLALSIDGIADELSATMAAGANLTLSGLSDSLKVDTTVGTSLELSGLSDSFSVDTAVGTALKVDGLSDSIALSTAGGDSLKLSSTGGLSVKDSAGDSFTVALGAVSLKNTAGANLAFNQAGLVKLGNSTGDVLQILGELLQTLSTDTYAGFNAPSNSVAQYAQLAIKLKLISG